MQQSTPTISRRTLYSSGLRLLSLILMSLTALIPALAENTNYGLCFPNTAWFALGSPKIDGCIDNCASGTPDTGWFGAFRYVFDNQTNGTPLPNVTVQGVRDASNIYLGFEYHRSRPAGDPGADSSNDAIMIGLDPTGNAADQRLLIIFPSTGGGTTTNTGPAVAPRYYVGANTFPTLSPLSGGTQAPNPTWLTAPAYNNLRISTVTSTAGGITDTLYSVELQIQIGGTDGIPTPNHGAAGNFGLYLNVIHIIGGAAEEDSWPPAPDTALTTGTFFTPPASTWGVGSFNGSCNGVSVASITANGGTTQLNLSTANNFSVVVQNKTLNSAGFGNSPAGTAVLAPKIVPKLLINHYGVPNVSSTTYPIPITVPAQDIAANSTATYNFNGWIPTSDQQTDFSATPHQCVVALLDATPPSTDPSCGTEAQTPWCYHANIINNAAIQNMNFGTVASGKMWRGPLAQIQTRGYTLMPDNHQTFTMQVRTAFLTAPRELGLRTSESSTGSAQSFLWTLHAYRQVKDTITINGNTFPILVNAGSFGYKLQYASGSADWRSQFFAEKDSKLEQIDGTTYKISIPQDQVGYVNSTVEGDAAAGTGGPIETGSGPGHMWPWWWWLVVLLLILILLLLLFRRRKHA